MFYSLDLTLNACINVFCYACYVISIHTCVFCTNKYKYVQICINMYMYMYEMKNTASKSATFLFVIVLFLLVELLGGHLHWNKTKDRFKSYIYSCLFSIEANAIFSNVTSIPSRFFALVLRCTIFGCF